ncbi:tripartite tricarboxylate transporter substrate binding protein [Ramlibacter sp. USB13]|uniref:Tripartite tricarboxylate transporter substrate binding protein n=1 Tax=Ramlibacter cellulosilyticus TaxID=2764187 RepID=A0A923MLZ5_9BURK|nr:tripartite tricarboxylate transporter substrate binding protein [Ramlibacter cellulosilyticus]MBC5781470.1 tripartite tricarboxylate transporter substrate binding protein [Ramlibacter cellulosilyticus]
MKRREAGLALAALALSSFSGLALAQAWPDKPVKLIVPYPPGASTDALGRLVAQKVGAALGQPVVVDNRGGASGNIGTELLAKSAADGYTFGLGTDATHAANVHLAAKPSFQPLKDFTPLSLAALNPIALVVHPSVPANNLRELIAYVKAHPDKGGYGSSGTGSPHHLSGELLRQRTGVPFVHVPYRGGGPALNDAIGGQIPMLFASVITVLPHVKEGRLKAIAVTSTSRYEGLPNVPTMAETLEGFDMPSWLAFFGPANLPEPIAKRLSDEINKALRDPEVKAKLVASGLVVVAGSPADLIAIQRRDYENKGKLIRDANIKAD